MSESIAGIHVRASLEERDNSIGEGCLLVDVDHDTKCTYMTYRNGKTLALGVEATLQLRDLLNKEFPA